MIKYVCHNCDDLECETSKCPICGNRTEIKESVIFWCPLCGAPSYDEKCNVCGSKCNYIGTDLRPVFPQERLLLIDKSIINQHNFMNFLHDMFAGKINITDSIVKIEFWDNFELNGKSKYIMFACFGNKPCENINVYQYGINQGKINGTLMDLSEIVNENFSFQIIEIGYMNSVLFLKGSIVEDNRLIGKNIIIEFVFDENNYSIEIINS